MANDPTIDELLRYSGKFRSELITGFYSELKDSATGLTTLGGVKSGITLPKIIVRKGLKPYTGKFKPKEGDINLTGRELTVKKAQRDIEIEPANYLGTFMEDQRGPGENAENRVIPFAEHTWNEVIREVAHEVVSEGIYFGEGKEAFAAYSAATAYAVGALVTFTQESELRYFRCITATTAGQSPDSHAAKWEWAGGRAIFKGFNRLFIEEIAAGRIQASQIVNTGVITKEDGYDQYTSVWRALPVAIRRLGGLIYTGLSNYDTLLDSLEANVTKYFEMIDGVVYLAKTDRKCIVQPVDWLSGSNRLIGTAKTNLYLGTDKSDDYNKISVKENHYTVEGSISFMVGVQVGDLEAMVLNDQQ